MAVLLTGGAGFIGTHTAVELLAAGHDIVVADNLYNAKPEALRRVRELSGKDFPFYRCDIRDREGLRRVFAENDIAAAVHFAGLKSPPESVSKPLDYFDNNVSGTVALCEVMAEAGCRRMVFSSSATVYGMKNPMPLREDMPTGEVVNPYGRTKFMIEGILRDLCAADPEWAAVSLRYFTLAGAHASGRIGEDARGTPVNLMPRLVQAAVGKTPALTVTGTDYDTPDGTGIRDYIHVVDLARGHLAAVEYALAHTGAEAVNLGVGRGYSVRELIKTFEEVNGVPVPTVNQPRRPGDVAVSYSDPSKAARLFGWKAEKTLADMCRDSWRWQSMNPSGYPED
ncbi:MAG: UDP-glucose 4-epimerase GalE [Oscillospiraceae bacterium]|nr:UDP-glucose 4-epimerase GalE [Oscillospiraceae bacterium]